MRDLEKNHQVTFWSLFLGFKRRFIFYLSVKRINHSKKSRQGILQIGSTHNVAHTLEVFSKVAWQDPFVEVRITGTLTDTRRWLMMKILPNPKSIRSQSSAISNKTLEIQCLIGNPKILPHPPRLLQFSCLKKRFKPGGFSLTLSLSLSPLLRISYDAIKFKSENQKK